MQILQRSSDATSQGLARSPSARRGRKKPRGLNCGAGARRVRMPGGHQRQRRARERPRAAGPSPTPRPPAGAPAQGACADGARQRAAGRDSQRLRRAAASLARTDAIIASPRQTPREFRSPHGNCSSRSRSRLRLPLPAGRERERERDLPSSLLPAPSSGRRARAAAPAPPTRDRPQRPAALRAPAAALSATGPPHLSARLRPPLPPPPPARCRRPARASRPGPAPHERRPAAGRAGRGRAAAAAQPLREAPGSRRLRARGPRLRSGSAGGGRFTRGGPE